jgi:asparagine synthase (glutamine-hydrolysing)
VCGIGALLDPAGAAATDAGQRMVDALRHRGPDGDAVERLGPATLACTRLAIIDVAGGDQPLFSEDRSIAVVANGEIYNHRELRSELEAEGHRLATGSDCEVLAHLYEEHGLEFVQRLNGMYGIALWDGRERRLVAARDPFGVKPLYWWSDGRRAAVASEVGALIAAGLVRPAIDEVALDHYLACRLVPGTRTLFEGVRKLAPGAVLTASESGEVKVTSLRRAPGAELDTPEDELAGALAGRFADAVERQMMSDVPYGAFLSGGVDSAAVVAAMAERSGDAPSTFTIGFPGAGRTLDERAAAAQSAQLLGAEHHDTAMVECDYLSELRRAVSRLEEPCGIPSAPALLQLSRFAAEQVKVVLSGQGADEPHGGYGRHRAAALLGPLARVPSPAARLAARLAGSLPRERARRLGHLLGPMEDARRLVRLVEVSDARMRRSLTGRSGEQAEQERSAEAADLLGDVPDRDLLGQALYLDTRLFLPSGLLICGDKMSMAASLEQRVPFLDVELMRFVERIPARTRLRKRLHRRAVGGLLPPELTRRPRHGFASPWDRWLRESLGSEIERRYAPGSELARLVDPAAAARMVRAHRSGRADHRWVLFCLLELSEWHLAFVGEPVPQPA